MRKDDSDISLDLNIKCDDPEAVGKILRENIRTAFPVIANALAWPLSSIQTQTRSFHHGRIKLSGYQQANQSGS